MDITEEFLHILQSLQLKCEKVVPLTDARVEKRTENSVQFMNGADRVGKNVVIICIKLEKLTSMSKQKSLFNDRPLEIENLIHMIKDDIENSIQQTANLQNEVQHSYNIKRGKNFNTHCSSVVLILQAKLAALSREFRQVLELRNENQKQLIARRDHFQQKPLSSSFPAFNTQGIHGSVLLGDEHVAINMSMDVQRQVLLNDDSDLYMESRRETMHNIESTIVELGKMFQSLAFMVKEQEEVIKRIDSNLEDTELNIQSAQGEILKFSRLISSSRYLIIKIFSVLIIFTFIFIFLA